jgi:SAM-dependent methyltransferase
VLGGALVSRDLNAIYGETFFADYSGTQVEDIRTVTDGLYEVFHPKACLDVGAGPGVLVKRLRELGVDAWGVDGSIHALTKADEDVRPYLRLEDITDPNALVDELRELVVCTEVAEHLPPELADVLVDKLCGVCAVDGAVVLTAAFPGQGGHDHVNEQPMFYYWVDKFRARGFEVDGAATQKLKHVWSPVTRMWWYAANVCVFRRAIAKVLSTRVDLVSVIVPCHKQSQYLAEALASVKAQTYEHVEVFVVTGDEESERVAVGLSDEYEFTLLPGHTRGLADARNQAIHWASGRYIACLDADDTWEPTYLEKAVNVSPVDQEVTITTCDMQYFGERTDYLVLGEYTHEKIKDACYLLVCSLYSRKLWELVGGYENAIFGYEDHDFWIKCSKHNPVVTKVSERLFNYRTHAEQGSNVCVRNDGALRAAMHLMHPDIYGPPRDEDLEALATCSEEARAKFLQRAEWFPNDRAGQMLKRLLEVGGTL